MSVIPEPFKREVVFPQSKVFADIQDTGLHGLWMALWH